MWSADPKHRDILLDECGLANANPVGTPVAAEDDLDWIAREKHRGHKVQADSCETQLLSTRPAGPWCCCREAHQVYGAATCQRRTDSEKGAQIFERATNFEDRFPLAACPRGVGRLD